MAKKDMRDEHADRISRKHYGAKFCHKRSANEMAHIRAEFYGTADDYLEEEEWYEK